ncbi:LmrA/YxaF family transcription factor [Streptomyces anthocyanicus]|uniref:LmrA/YxaF family transcription factor n=1 Tax=Streptomyces anthocyanicus TaxID=68174 RepID=UPI002DD8258A|nr:hypothetical protein [Streptomyces anthocyanicus]WSB66443.1 hypothetical protein OIE72_39570 [Streptomyces anthocyanicus]
MDINDDAPQLARSSSAAVFARWQKALAGLLVRHGLTEERARRLGAKSNDSARNSKQADPLPLRTHCM